MILDQELSQLTQGEAGALGNFGFVGLGGALGLIPSIVSMVYKLYATPNSSFDIAEMATACTFVFCVSVSIVCLFVSRLYSSEIDEIANTIRKREWRGIKETD